MSISRKDPPFFFYKFFYLNEWIKKKLIKKYPNFIIKLTFLNHLMGVRKRKSCSGNGTPSKPSPPPSPGRCPFPGCGSVPPPRGLGKVLCPVHGTPLPTLCKKESVSTPTSKKSGGEETLTTMSIDQAEKSRRVREWVEESPRQKRRKSDNGFPESVFPIIDDRHCFICHKKIGELGVEYHEMMGKTVVAHPECSPVLAPSPQNVDFNENPLCNIHWGEPNAYKCPVPGCETYRCEECREDRIYPQDYPCKEHQCHVCGGTLVGIHQDQLLRIADIMGDFTIHKDCEEGFNGDIIYGFVPSPPSSEDDEPSLP
jgi:hypothetical protein